MSVYGEGGKGSLRIGGEGGFVIYGYKFIIIALYIVRGFRPHDFLCSLHQIDHRCGSQATSILGTRSFFPRAAGCFGVGRSISRARPETAHEKSLAPRVSHFFLG